MHWALVQCANYYSKSIRTNKHTFAAACDQCCSCFFSSLNGVVLHDVPEQNNTDTKMNGEKRINNTGRTATVCIYSIELF